MVLFAILVPLTPTSWFDSFGVIALKNQNSSHHSPGARLSAVESFLDPAGMFSAADFVFRLREEQRRDD
jgi:hypothetical protein